MKGWIGVLALMVAVAGCAQGGPLGMRSDTEIQPSQFASSGFDREASAKGTVAGVEDGGLIGGRLGADLSRKDHLYGLEAEYRALETAPAGQPVTWEDEGTDSSGRVVAAQPYRVGSQDCRQYSHTVDIADIQRSAKGTACRNDDGSWIVLD